MGEHLQQQLHPASAAGSHVAGGMYGYLVPSCLLPTRGDDLWSILDRFCYLSLPTEEFGRAFD